MGKAKYYSNQEKVLENIISGNILRFMSNLERLQDGFHSLRPVQQRKGYWRVVVRRKNTDHEVEVEKHFLSGSLGWEKLATFFAQFVTAEEVAQYGGK